MQKEHDDITYWAVVRTEWVNTCEVPELATMITVKALPASHLCGRAHRSTLSSLRRTAASPRGYTQTEVPQIQSYFRNTRKSFCFV